MMLPSIQLVSRNEMGRIVHEVPTEILALESNIICTEDDWFGTVYHMVYFCDNGTSVKLREFDPATGQQIDSDWQTIAEIRGKGGW